MRDRGPRRAWSRDLPAALLALASLACGGSSPSAPSSAPAADSAVVTLTSANFQDVVLSGRDVCLVEFYSPSCGFCQQMEPVVRSLASAYRGRAVVGRIQVEREQDLVQSWSVRGTPTYVLVKGGREAGRHVGTATYEQLDRLLASGLAP